MDSRLLDVEMGKVDWSKHNGFFGVASELDGSNDERHMQRTMAMLYRFGVADGTLAAERWQRANEMSDALMLKHFKGTALEESIMASVDFRRSTFLGFVSLYLGFACFGSGRMATYGRGAGIFEYKHF